MGRIPFDLLVLNVQLVNVLTAKIYPADIAIIDGEFAFIGKALPIHSAEAYFDAKGAFAVPGYIDSHMHIESSMMTPENFARAVVPMGTTTVAADPHEIANVLGERGVQLLADRSRGLPLHIPNSQSFVTRPAIPHQSAPPHHRHLPSFPSTRT